MERCDDVLDVIGRIGGSGPGRLSAICPAQCGEILMNSDAWMLLLLFLLTLGLLAWPLGQLLTRLIEGELPRPLLRLERLCLERLCLGAATEEMDWRRYAGA